MSCLTAVETDPNIVVVGDDLTGIALRGPHGVLAPELCVRGPWSCHLRLSSVLHWGLGPWCVIAEASGLLETILSSGFSPFLNMSCFFSSSFTSSGA